MVAKAGGCYVVTWSRDGGIRPLTRCTCLLLLRQWRDTAVCEPIVYWRWLRGVEFPCLYHWVKGWPTVLYWKIWAGWNGVSWREGGACKTPLTAYPVLTEGRHWTCVFTCAVEGTWLTEVSKMSHITPKQAYPGAYRPFPNYRPKKNLCVKKQQ